MDRPRIMSAGILQISRHGAGCRMLIHYPLLRMPYAMCPICGAMMHLNVGDHAAWYAERHPEAKFGDLVPEPCPFCFGVIASGDHVVTRRLVNDNLTIEPGQRGEVRAVYVNREFGKLYVVALESEKSITVPRAALRKLRAGEG